MNPKRDHRSSCRSSLPQYVAPIACGLLLAGTVSAPAAEALEPTTKAAAKKPPQTAQRPPARPTQPGKPPSGPVPNPATWYSVNGTGNNLAHTGWGATGVTFLRKAPADYGDGVETPAGSDRASARAISNKVSDQSDDEVNSRSLSGFVYAFGQFLDHDITLTRQGTSESFPISVPTGDTYFDPNSTGSKTIGMKRSVFDTSTGTGPGNPRQQINSVTSFIDGSQIYGSDATRARALRTFSSGKLRTSAGGMLPFNTDGLENDNAAHVVEDSKLFLAGDVRANENPALTALQTLFMREHNRIATLVARAHPTWNDEALYQESRRIVVGELQAIAYNEFLPSVLGSGAIPQYRGYQSNTNPTITNEFATAGYRFGHSTLDGDVARMNDDGSQPAGGDLELREAFFNPSVFNPSLPDHEGDIDPFLKGLATENAQEVDTHLVDDIRNFLFGAPGAGGFDLAALNIQRGRDHGLPDYNTVRAAYGLPRVTSFAQITPDPQEQANLRSVYPSVDDIDVWSGGLAERHAPGASVGPLFQKIMVDQFTRLRDGDRLFYMNSPNRALLPQQVGGTRLSDVIRRNTSLRNIQPNVFVWRES